ncbi:hypothetical protein RCL_jg13302.t1 [Rhizophagus clarus]|uniref:Uncharacterized protein n=1 Tax=Rhizophagus clarus TaxID=94130 RepID=A0A8H3LQ56_9GLOM|nr:hypothetical protein RCL_jg13302.t1 [Rhizophagus clarus]
MSSSLQEQIIRLVTIFCKKKDLLRYKVFFQKTGIPNILLFLIINVSKRASKATIDNNPFIYKSLSSYFKNIMQKAALLDILCESKKIRSSSIKLQSKSSIIIVDNFTTPNMDIYQPKSSEKLAINTDKQDNSNESYHNSHCTCNM